MVELAADLCIIGAGSAGLTAAAIATQLGTRVVLIERAEMGGECLNTGCVPSKALLAAAKAAHVVRTGSRFGVNAGEPRIDFAAVHAHVHEVIGRIAPHDSVERFEGMGAQVLREEARFIEPRVVMAGEHRVRARRVIIATGSVPAEPRIEGLDSVDYFTNETIFDHRTLPAHLITVGGGPIGIELAQAFCRLGARVTVVENEHALPRDDRELAARLLKILAGEGVVIREQAKVTKVRKGKSAIVLSVEEAGQGSELSGSHLLLATGRRPSLSGLDLDRAGVRFSDEGIIVDDKLRTSARGVYAIGDVVAKAPRFTHIASYHAGVAVRNAVLFPFTRTNYDTLPWVTYTDPELAQVGASEDDARKEHGDDIRVVRFEMEANDRAQAERETTGAVKLVARKNGKVLGVSILGPNAGELTHPWGLAIGSGLKLSHLARMVAAYPTLGEASKSVAIEFYKPKVFGELARRLVRLLSRLP